ncbi:uncharacterized protein CLUP02_10680 [Colletotrichum lupini]|uniref:Uncharacterized protein n=1 Tax=Colletotrichum lupini TaxID=145971 RepID=A0A9Q8SX13_9PEZI|nr:uncharacterized protein CLUP02_10680 [Colletotrichum lupini]UQC85184.1 hypothetical protein CLUP02_10680 [Colletotrichum lupini]
MSFRSTQQKRRVIMLDFASSVSGVPSAFTSKVDPGTYRSRGHMIFVSPRATDTHLGHLWGFHLLRLPYWQMQELQQRRRTDVSPARIPSFLKSQEECMCTSESPWNLLVPTSGLNTGSDTPGHTLFALHPPPKQATCFLRPRGYPRAHGAEIGTRPNHSSAPLSDGFRNAQSGDHIGVWARQMRVRKSVLDLFVLAYNYEYDVAVIYSSTKSLTRMPLTSHPLQYPTYWVHTPKEDDIRLRPFGSPNHITGGPCGIAFPHRRQSCTSRPVIGRRLHLKRERKLAQPMLAASYSRRSSPHTPTSGGGAREVTRNEKAREESLLSKLPRRKVHLASGLELTCIAKPAARREAGNTKRKGRLMRPGPGMAHSPASGTPMSAIYGSPMRPLHAHAPAFANRHQENAASRPANLLSPRPLPMLSRSTLGKAKKREARRTADTATLPHNLLSEPPLFPPPCFAASLGRAGQGWSEVREHRCDAPGPAMAAWPGLPSLLHQTTNMPFSKTRQVTTQRDETAWSYQPLQGGHWCRGTHEEARQDVRDEHRGREGGGEPFQASKFYPDLTIHPVSKVQHDSATHKWTARRHEVWREREAQRTSARARKRSKLHDLPSMRLLAAAQVRKSHFTTPALFPEGASSCTSRPLGRASESFQGSSVIRDLAAATPCLSSMHTHLRKTYLPSWPGQVETGLFTSTWQILSAFASPRAADPGRDKRTRRASGGRIVSSLLFPNLDEKLDLVLSLLLYDSVTFLAHTGRVPDRKVVCLVSGAKSR